MSRAPGERCSAKTLIYKIPGPIKHQNPMVTGECYQALSLTTSSPTCPLSDSGINRGSTILQCHPAIAISIQAKTEEKEKHCCHRHMARILT